MHIVFWVYFSFECCWIGVIGEFLGMGQL